MIARYQDFEIASARDVSDVIQADLSAAPGRRHLTQPIPVTLPDDQALIEQTATDLTTDGLCDMLRIRYTVSASQTAFEQMMVAGNAASLEIRSSTPSKPSLSWLRRANCPRD